MFFYASKILWFFATPSNLFIAATIVGAVLWRRRGGRQLALAGAGALVLSSLTPLPWLIAAPLENRFARPPGDFAQPTGIVVLGGAMDEELSMARGTPTLTDAGARMTDAVALARRFPQARLVFSGGSARLGEHAATEADAARQLWLSLGVPPERMTFEDRSRNTYENAVFTRDLVQPKASEIWLLVTSAQHMPRAIGIFRKIGFAVVPWPGDYHTFGDARDWRPSRSAGYALRLFDDAVREWIGLAAYYAAGRTDALFPAP